MKIFRSRLLLYVMVNGLILAVVAAALFPTPPPAAAQCGSSASSCRNCHETQGQMPVNNSGEWHTAHAFGDFCEFCHAGNVQSMAKDEAHMGMVDPLEDVQASCQGCHPDDFTDRAQVYASALGVEVGGTGAGSGEGGAPAPAPAPTSAPASAVGAPAGVEEIDYNLLYAEKYAPPPFPWGNVVTGFLVVVVGVVFLALAWRWENWDLKYLPREIGEVFERKPGMRELWPRLVDASPDTLEALSSVLQDRKYGEETLQTVAHIDREMVHRLRQMNPQERDVAVTLAKQDAKRDKGDEQ